MKECELCVSPARIFCESDQASLCWSCDLKIHSANFLVAKHSRNLLCHICQSPTPWKASGPKLGSTISVCEKCVSNHKGRRLERSREEEESEGGNEDDDDDDEDEDEETDSDDDYDEDGENQVVPWTSISPPQVSSSLSSEESSSRFFSEVADVSKTLKRMRENADLEDVKGDLRCPSSQPKNNAASPGETARNSAEDEATSFGSCRSLKDRRRELPIQSALNESESDLLVSSLREFHQNMISGIDGSAKIFEIRKQSKDPIADDFASVIS